MDALPSFDLVRPRTLAELMEARREAYARAALTIDTSDLNIDQVVEAIVTKITLNRCDGCQRSA